MSTTLTYRFVAALLVVASLGIASPRVAWCLDVTESGGASPIELVNPLPPVAHAPQLPSAARAMSLSSLATSSSDPAAVELIPAGDVPPVGVESNSCAKCSHRSCCCSQGRCQTESSGRWRCWHTQIKPCLQAHHWGYREYFCERPFGVCNFQAAQTMIANGLRDQMVLYEYDFGFGENNGTLKERGLVQLEKMLRRIPNVACPVIIEASSDPQLDAARQLHVLDTLAKLGVELGPDMVVVDRPGVRGLAGEEAPIIHMNLLEQTRLRGNVGIETSGLRDIGYGSSSTGSAASGAPSGEQSR